MDRKQRNLNRVAHLKKVKQQLFNNAAISRADISRNTGLHKSTITSLFDELDQEGIIKHLGRGDSTGSGGRKPELYTFNTHYGYVACFNITYDHLYVMFLYIDGQEISFKRLAMATRKADVLINLIKRELAQQAASDDTEHGLVGIGVSIHAVVDNNQIVHSPYYQFNQLDLQQYLIDQYGVPVLIGNEANLAAIYERDYARKKRPRDFIVLSLHRGPGIGVIANRQLFNGFQGMVGELGSVRPLNPVKGIKDIGDFLSADFLQENLCTALKVDSTNADYATLNKLVQAQPGMVKEIINNFAAVSANVLYNLQMLYGPAEVFINSPLIEQLTVLGEAVKKQCKAVGLPVPVTIIKGSQYVSLLGAGAAVIRHVLDLHDVSLSFRWSKEIG